MKARALIYFTLALLLCGEAPGVGSHFSDVTAGSGLVVAQDTGEKGTNCHAVAIEDFNGDGRPDVIITSFTRGPHVHYFENRGGLRFVEKTRGSGLESFTADGSGAAVADFDHDGKLDVFLGALRGGSSRLYRGRGDGTFEDVTARSKINIPVPARSCSWSDVDGDGWVDLYVTSPEGRNYLYLNNRNGTFREVAQSAGVALEGRESLGCAFADVDGDGKDDLFVTNYHSQVSALFKNLGGGKFRDVTQSAGLAKRNSAVGCAFGDVFNRGVMDLYVTTDSWLSGANYHEAEMRAQGNTVESNQLYRNDGKGHFTPVVSPALQFKSLCHDIDLEDLDNGGQLEIYAGVDAQSGNQWATSKGGNPLWVRSGENWRESGRAWGVNEEANCVCVPAADLDGDGDLDLLLINFYSNPRILRNNTNDRNWLEIRARGTRSNPDGIGAKVYVYAGSRLVGFRHIQSGFGYGRCSPLMAHFGLGPRAAASYRVEVVFSGTGKRVVREAVAPGQKLVIQE